MKTLVMTFAAGAIVAAAPGQAQSQPQPQVQGNGGAGRGAGWMQRDQTRAEAQQRADTMFQMLDANHDGTVTKAEADDALAKLQAMAASDSGSGRGGGGRVRMLQQLVERLFATAPSITQQQFEAVMLARFDAMDLNHDGVVTAAEREQAREERRQGAPAAAPAVAPNTTPQ